MDMWQLMCPVATNVAGMGILLDTAALEATQCGSRLEPRNVNGHPWSLSLGQDFQTKSQFRIRRKMREVLWKHLFSFQSQPYNTLFASPQILCG